MKLLFKSSTLQPKFRVVWTVILTDSSLPINEYKNGGRIGHQSMPKMSINSATH
ncbi:hypothetical protein BDZ91DRAFT_727870 [Kalaharituber pfeilii]|nr:hypothetical protein BDZ91DRAFT_727870 [Kalaharituber pfeilii]